MPLAGATAYNQIGAVAKLLNGVDVLAIPPTGAGKTAILTMFMHPGPHEA